jgi:NADH dehydrogenase/NADH:ubiquinone oxidoreductase subunit G
MNQFKRWLRAQLAYLDKLADQDELADVDFDDVGRIITEAARRASKLGFGQWARYAATEQLAPQRARELLAEMIAATQSKPTQPSELLTLEQAADYLGYSPSGLRKMAKRGDVRFVQSKPNAPLKFRREWLDELGAKPKTEPTQLPGKGSHGFHSHLLG